MTYAGFVRVLEDRAGHEVCARRSSVILPESRSRSRVGGVLPAPIVEPLPQQALAGGRDALEQHLADEVVAEAEAEAVDAEDPPFAEALELLDELGGVDAEEVCERLRLERLLEHGGGDEDAVAQSPSARHWASSASVERPRRAGGVAVRERLGDEARVAAGRLVQLGNPEWRELVGRERLEADDARPASRRRGG